MNDNACIRTLIDKFSIYLLICRYNEIDKPVCRVCDVVLKSDYDWTAHQASRKHHEVKVIHLWY